MGSSPFIRTNFYSTDQNTRALNITEEKRESALLELKVEINQDDYLEQFKDKVREYRKQINLPGFRQGMVPSNLVKKRFGLTIMNEILSSEVMPKVQEYIQEQNLATYGQPLLVSTDLGKKQPVDEHDYEMVFDVGIMPEIAFDTSALKQITEYEVEITEDDLDEDIRFQQYRHGFEQEAETVEGGEVYKIGGVFYEIDENGEQVQDGLHVKLDFLTLHYQHFLEQLQGLKAGEEVDTTFEAFFPPTASGPRVLNISPEDYEGIKQKPLRFQIETIKIMQPHPIDQDFFKLFGMEDENMDEATFREKYRSALQERYRQEANNKKQQDLENMLLEQANFELPTAYVAQLILSQSDDINSVEELYQQYPNFHREFKLHIAQQALLKQHPELEIQDNEVQEQMKEQFRSMLQGQFTPSGAEASSEEGEAEAEAEAEAQGETAEAAASSATSDPATASEEETPPEAAPAGEAEAVATERIGEEADNEGVSETEDPTSGMSEAQQEELLDNLVGSYMQDSQQLQQQKDQLQRKRIHAFLEEQVEVQHAKVSKDEFERAVDQS